MEMPKIRELYKELKELDLPALMAHQSENPKDAEVCIYKCKFIRKKLKAFPNKILYPFAIRNRNTKAWRELGIRIHSGSFSSITLAKIINETFDWPKQTNGLRKMRNKAVQNLLSRVHALSQSEIVDILFELTNSEKALDYKIPQRILALRLGERDTERIIEQLEDKLSQNTSKTALIEKISSV